MENAKYTSYIEKFVFFFNERKVSFRKANLKAPIIWMFVRVISAFVLLILKLRTTSVVAFANKSSDKLEAREAEGNKIINSTNFY